MDFYNISIELYFKYPQKCLNSILTTYASVCVEDVDLRKVNKDLIHTMLKDKIQSFITTLNIEENDIVYVSREEYLQNTEDVQSGSVSDDPLSIYGIQE